MNVFKQFIYSLYSPKTMATFRNQGAGKSFLYVLLLMTIAFAPNALDIHFTVSNAVQEIEEMVEEDIRDFEVNNGELTSLAESTIRRHISGYEIIFDSTGTIQTSDLSHYDEAIGFLKHNLVTVTRGQVVETPYADYGNLTITKENVTSLLDLSPLLSNILILILFILLIAMKFVGITFLSLIGQFAKKTFNLSLTYKQIWVLSIYTVTLPTIFFSLIKSLGINIPYSFGLYWMVAIVLLYTTFKEVKVLEQ